MWTIRLLLLLYYVIIIAMWRKYNEIFPSTCNKTELVIRTHGIFILTQYTFKYLIIIIIIDVILVITTVQRKAHVEQKLVLYARVHRDWYINTRGGDITISFICLYDARHFE